MTGRRFRVAAPRPLTEHSSSFECFGGRCTVLVADAQRPADAAEAVAMTKQTLRAWHERFSRFDPGSELARLNRDPRSQVPADPLMRRLIEAALRAAKDTGGLVDATLGPEIIAAGYKNHFEGDGIPLEQALALAPERRPANPHPDSAVARTAVDHAAGVVIRPPGVVLDLGGVAKGVFADELAGRLEGFDAFAADCAGDIRFGGHARRPRPINVTSPFDGMVLHTFDGRSGAVATSGIGKRSWLHADGRPGHHLLDPRTGRPAYTGVVQATAFAPTAAGAEVLAKAAVLSGPDRAAEWLSHGGLFVRDDGTYVVLEPATEEAPPPSASPPEPVSSRSASQPRTSPSTASRSGSFKISWNSPA
jgi:thiamine biosynthesis lipoprotein